MVCKAFKIFYWKKQIKSNFKISFYCTIVRSLAPRNWNSLTQIEWNSNHNFILLFFRWNVLPPMTITDGSISVKRRTEWPLMLYNMPAPYDRLINYCHFCALKETVPRAWAAPTKTQWWVLKFHEFSQRIGIFGVHLPFSLLFGYFGTFWMMNFDKRLTQFVFWVPLAKGPWTPSFLIFAIWLQIAIYMV